MPRVTNDEANAVLAASLRFERGPPPACLRANGGPADPVACRGQRCRSALRCRARGNRNARHADRPPGMDSRPLAKARCLSRTSMMSASGRGHMSSGPTPWIKLATRPPQAGGADGSAATLRLPARIDTRLAIGVPRTIVRRRVERRNGRRRLVRRRVRQLTSNVIPLLRHSREQFGFSGFLTNADGATHRRRNHRSSREESWTVALPASRTCNDGDRRQVPLRGEGDPKPGERSLFRYGGSRRIGSATSDFTLLVPASHHHRSRPTPPPQWTAGRSSPDDVITRPLPKQRKARRDAGVLPWTMANVLDCAGGRSTAVGASRTGSVAPLGE